MLGRNRADGDPNCLGVGTASPYEILEPEWVQVQNSRFLDDFEL
jgi:hypothetical protein